MSEILETIAINDNYRVAVTYDDISDCPLAWDDEINAHTIRADRDALNMKELGVYDAEGYALDTLVDTLDYYGNGDPDERDTAILKHLKRKGYAARIAEVGGRASWHLAVFYARPDGGDVNAWKWIKGNIRTFEQWRDGEVYILTLERRTTWTSDTGDTRETWEAVNSCGCYYFDGRDDLLTQAREFANDFLPDAQNVATA